MHPGLGGGAGPGRICHSSTLVFSTARELLRRNGVRRTMLYTGWVPSRRKPHPPRTCRTCAKTFVPHDGRQQFCDVQCRQAQYRVEHAARVCPHCSTSFVPIHGRMRFCSAGCLYDFHNPPRLYEKPCAQCGAATLRPKFCSDACVRADENAEIPPRICADCGGEFKKRGRHSGNGRYCFPCVEKRIVPPKPKPFRKVSRGRVLVRVCKRPKVRTFVAGACPCCGDAFVAPAWTNPRYCSSACTVLAHRDQYRARKRRAQGGEKIYRRKVFERDGWTCRLCREPIDREAKVPHPKAATVDHILPLALGGLHVYENVQTAHFICNSRKSAQISQLSFAA